MRDFRVYAPAKLNLYLDVLGKRPDGYHTINTLFEKIDLRDELIVKKTVRGLRVTAQPSGICPSGEKNIVYKALERLFEEAGVKIGLDIVINKKIPVSSGLGGGSSDAASIMRSVNEIFDLGISSERLFFIANDIGKDVPFFTLDAPFAIAKGTGELLEPIDTDSCFWHVVINPAIGLSTAEMYKKLDEFGLSSRSNDIKDIIEALGKKDIQALKKAYYNVFEQVSGDHICYIEKAKTLLSEAGQMDSFLSGSGPTVFCIHKEREEARKIIERMPEVNGMDIFLAATYKGGIYGDNGGQMRSRLTEQSERESVDRI